MIHIMGMLMIMVNWETSVIDVKSTFLNRGLQDGMKFSQKYKKFNGKEVLLLEDTFYGLKLTSMGFFKNVESSCTNE